MDARNLGIFESRLRVLAPPNHHRLSWLERKLLAVIWTRNHHKLPQHMRPFCVVRLEDEIARVSRVEGRLSTTKRENAPRCQDSGSQESDARHGAPPPDP